jgi:autotransporter-associated beta strand protein
MKTCVLQAIAASFAGKSRALKLAAIALPLALASGQLAMAGTLYWEPTGTTGANATGTWTTATTTLDWTTDSTGLTTPEVGYSAGSDVIFSADPDATGASTITLAGATISVNSLTFGNGGAIGATGASTGATGGYTFTSGETLNVGPAAGGTIMTLNPGVGPVTFQGTFAPVNTSGTATIVDNSANSLTFGGTVSNGNNASMAITGTGIGGVTFNGSINGNSTSNVGESYSLNFLGAGPVTLNAQDNATGVATVSGSSTLSLGAALALQGYELNLNAGGTVYFGSNVTSANIAGLSGAGSLVLSNTAATPAAVNVTLQGIGGTNGLNPGQDFGAGNPTNSINISGLGGVTINSVTVNNRANGGTETFGGNLTFSGGLNFSNTGPTFTANAGAQQANTTVVLTGTGNTYGGSTTIGAAGTATDGTTTLKIGTGTTGSLPAGSAIIDNGILIIDTNAANPVSNTAGISGTGTVTNSGADTLTLSGPNTYTGATTISNGGLVLENGASLGNTMVTVSTAGTLFAVTPGVNGGANGSTIAMTGTLSLGTGTAFTMVDGITSTFTVAQASLAGANPLSFDLGGGNSDVLAIAGAGTDGAGETVTVHALGALTGTSYAIITAGSGLTPANFSLATSRAVFGNTAYALALAGSGTNESVNIISTGAAAVYFTGNAGGPLNNTIVATGTTTNFSSSISGVPDAGQPPSYLQDVYFTANTVTTGTTISGLGVSSTFNSVNFTAGSPAVTINDNTNTLTISGTQGITDLSGTTQTLNVPITLGIAQSFSNTGSGELVISGSVSGTKALTISGGGPATLSNVNDSYSGGLTISNGRLLVDTFNNVSTNGELGHNTSVTLGALGGSAGTLEYTGGNASTTMPFTLATGGTGVFQIDSAATSGTLAGVVSGGGALMSSGSGTLTLSAVNTYTGPTTISSGTLALGGAGTLGSGNYAGAISNSGALVYNSSATQTLSGIISGPGSVTSGSGNLTLSGPNTYTGGLTVNAATVTITGNQSAATGSINIGNPGVAVSTLNIGTTAQTAATTVVVSSNNAITVGPPTGGSFGRSIYVYGASAALPTSVTDNGSLALQRGSSLYMNAFSTWTQNGAMTVAGNGGYTALLSSTGSFIYAGSSPILFQGTLNAGLANEIAVTSGTFTTGQGINFNQGAANGIVLLSNSGTLMLSANVPTFATVQAATTGTSQFQLGGGAGGVINTGGFSTAISIPFVNAAGATGALTKLGSGTLTLSNSNTYTGTTTVAAGTLFLSGSLSGSSSVKVAGATASTVAALEGTGYIANAVTIGNGGNNPSTAIISVGVPASTGTMTLGGGLTLNSDAAYVFNLNPTLGTSDLLNVTGAITLNSPALTMNLLSDTILSGGQVFDIANSSTNTFNGTFAGLSDGTQFAQGDNTYQINYGTSVPDELTLTVVAAIPEPGTWAMLLCGAGILGIRRLSRRGSKGMSLL